MFYRISLSILVSKCLFLAFFDRQPERRHKMMRNKIWHNMSTGKIFSMFSFLKDWYTSMTYATEWSYILHSLFFIHIQLNLVSPPMSGVVPEMKANYLRNTACVMTLCYGLVWGDEGCYWRAERSSAQRPALPLRDAEDCCWISRTPALQLQIKQTMTTPLIMIWSCR